MAPFRSPPSIMHPFLSWCAVRGLRTSTSNSAKCTPQGRARALYLRSRLPFPLPRRLRTTHICGASVVLLLFSYWPCLRLGESNGCLSSRSRASAKPRQILLHGYRSKPVNESGKDLALVSRSERNHGCPCIYTHSTCLPTLVEFYDAIQEHPA